MHLISERGSWVLALVALLFASAPAHAANEIPGYVVLPLIQIGPHAAGIRATIDGHPVSLLVDTGASHTVLDRRLYKGIVTASNQTPQSTLPAGFPTSTHMNGLSADIGQIQNLQAGAMHFGNGPVIVMDLSVMTDAYHDFNRTHRDAPIAGLIGEDILTHYSAIIDWRRHGIYFNTDPAKRLKLGKSLVASGWTVVPMSRTSNRHYAVPTTIDDRSFQMVVDTGASFTALHSGLLGTRHVVYNRGALMMSMIGSASVGRPVVLDHWMIGNYRVPPVAVITQTLPSSLLNETSAQKSPMIGLLGREVLARNSAIIDIHESTLYLKPSSAR